LCKPQKQINNDEHNKEVIDETADIVSGVGERTYAQFKEGKGSYVQGYRRD